MVTDPIGDLLVQIKNAALVKKDSIRIPHSKLKIMVLRVLVDRGFVEGFQETQEGAFKYIDVRLLSGAITDLERVSRPGRRVYAPSSKIPRVLSGRGLLIVSTPQGVMAGDEARKKNLGGELLAKVW